LRKAICIKIAFEIPWAISAPDGTMLNGGPMGMNGTGPSFLEIQCAIRGAEIIGDTGCEWRTRKLALDPFPAAYIMDSL
jgi:hypothetical protein